MRYINKVGGIVYALDCNTSIHEMNQMLTEVKAGESIWIEGYGSASEWLRNHEVDLTDDFMNKFSTIAFAAETHCHDGITYVAADVDANDVDTIYDAFVTNYNIKDFSTHLEQIGFVKDDSTYVWRRDNIIVSAYDVTADGGFGYIEICSKSYPNGNEPKKIINHCRNEKMDEPNNQQPTDDIPADHSKYVNKNGLEFSYVLTSNDDLHYIRFTHEIESAGLPLASYIEMINRAIEIPSLAECMMKNLGFEYDADILDGYECNYSNGEVRIGITENGGYDVFSYNEYVNALNNASKPLSKGENAEKDASVPTTQENGSSMPTKEELNKAMEMLAALNEYMHRIMHT